MRYRGRVVNPVSLWEQFTEIPESKKDDTPFIHGLHCPNPEHHNSRLPGPFQVNVTQPTVHCFARCGISGSYEHAIRVVTGCSLKESRRVILEHSRIPTKGSKRKRHSGDPSSVGGLLATDDDNGGKGDSLAYDTFISQFGMDYLTRRGVDGSSVGRWNLGWDSDDRRLVIPVADERGILRFLIKRAVREKDHPKYLNVPAGFPKTSLLFGACLLDRERVRSQGLVLVEGPLDAIILYQHGITIVVAVMGAGLSDKQVKIVNRLRPRRVYCMFDKDAGGIYSLRATVQALQGKYPVQVCRYPKGRTDPATLTREEAIRSIERAIPVVKLNRQIRSRQLRGVAYG
jgi:5S rRNA maturation endonuclease (ribonuclease M5)